VLRNLKDYLLGYCRVSPYALTRDEGFRSIVPELVRFKPRYLIGYTSIVERLAYANRSTPDLLQGLALKGVIVSSDGFISPNGRRVVEEVFGCPVILEYGSIETDVMAYTNLAGHFQVFWQNHFLEVLPGQDGESGELLVTDLFPRCCPLVRYRIGDEIILCQEDTGLQYGLTRFQAVRGRMHDFVLMPDGQRIYAYLFYTVLKEFSEVVTRVQIVQLIDGVAIDVQSPLETIPDGILGEMHRRLRNLNPLQANIDIRVVKQLHQTARGKTPSVWLESPPTT
jgi:phenylacetate-CoA ligase